MSSNDRQRVERVPGARRARLTAAPDTTAEPVPADDSVETPGLEPGAAAGPNDERMRRDKPPHW
jgi:hypothetical protein